MFIQKLQVNLPIFVLVFLFFLPQLQSLFLTVAGLFAGRPNVSGVFSARKARNCKLILKKMCVEAYCSPKGESGAGAINHP